MLAGFPDVGDVTRAVDAHNELIREYRPNADVRFVGKSVITWAFSQTN